MEDSNGTYLLQQQQQQQQSAVIGWGPPAASWLLTWLATTLALAVWWVVLHRLRQRHMLGPRTWPVLGCLPEQIRHFDRLHHWLLDYFRTTWTFSAPVIGVNNTFTASPANVEHILKTNFANYPKGELLRQRFRDMMGHGIFNVDGEMWMHATFEFASSKLQYLCL